MIDHDLPSDVRALLAAGRDHLGPDAATIARLRSRIDATIATSVAPAAAAKALGVKLSVVAVTALVGASVYRYVDERSAPQTPRALQIAVEDEPMEVETRIALASREAPPPSAPAPRVASPPVIATVEPVVETPVIVPAEQGISLAREIELVDRAMLGLKHRNFDAALLALRIYAEETQGRGQLAQDAAAIKVEVLCERKDPTAATELAALERHWPRSPHRSHLRATCALREENKR